MGIPSPSAQQDMRHKEGKGTTYVSNFNVSEGGRKAENWVSRDNQTRSAFSTGNQISFPSAVRLRSMQGNSLTSPIIAP